MTRPRSLAIFVLAVVLALPGPVARADEVMLTNGEVLKGRIVKEKADYVVLEQGSVRTEISRDQIREIRKGDAPAPPPPPPPPPSEGNPPRERPDPSPAERPGTERPRAGAARILSDAIRELDAIPVEAGTGEPEPRPRDWVRPEEADKGPVKIADLDGSIRYAENLPGDGRRVRSAWKMEIAPEAFRDEGGFALDPVPGGSTHHWVAQHWLAEEGAWTGDDPTWRRVRRERGIFERALRALYTGGGPDPQAEGEQAYRAMEEARTAMAAAAYEEERAQSKIDAIQQGRYGGDEMERSQKVMDAEREAEQAREKRDLKRGELRNVALSKYAPLPDTGLVGSVADGVAELHILLDRKLPRARERIGDIRAASRPGMRSDPASIAIQMDQAKAALADVQQQIARARERIRGALKACAEALR